MKGKDGINKKIPWYVRYSEWVLNVVLGKTGKVIAAIVCILTSLISYGILKNRPMTPYEEAYDIEFKNYVNAELGDIANIVISQYSMETGKNPFFSYDEEEFKMDIEMSKDFQIINQSSSVVSPPTYKDYQQTIYPRELIISSLGFGLFSVLLLAGIAFFISISALVPVIASELWKNKNPDLYNEYFHD